MVESEKYASALCDLAAVLDGSFMLIVKGLEKTGRHTHEVQEGTVHATVHTKISVVTSCWSLTFFCCRCCWEFTLFLSVVCDQFFFSPRVCYSSLLSAR